MAWLQKNQKKVDAIETFSFINDQDYDVHVEPSTLMKIYRMARRQYPTPYAGSLIGLVIDSEEDGVKQKTIEVTGIINTEDKTSILNLAKFVGNDCEVVGYFTSSEVEPVSDLQTIRQLEDGYNKTSIPQVFIRCDFTAGDAANLSNCFLAQRLGPNATVPLVPVPLNINMTSLQSAFMFEWSLTSSAPPAPLVALKDRETKKTISSIYRGLDELTNRQEGLLQTVRAQETHAKLVDEWMEKRRLENQNRFLNDQEPLPCTRIAALKALGEAPAPAKDNLRTCVATSAPLFRAVEEIVMEQDHKAKRQIFMNSAL